MVDRGRPVQADNLLIEAINLLIEVDNLLVEVNNLLVQVDNLLALVNNRLVEVVFVLGSRLVVAVDNQLVYGCSLAAMLHN